MAAAKKRSVKRTKKKASAPKKSRPTLVVEATVSDEELELATQSRRQEYDEVIKQVRKLRVGQSIVLGYSTSDDKELVRMRNRLSAKLRRTLAKEMEGHLRVSITAGKKIAVRHLPRQ